MKQKNIVYLTLLALVSLPWACSNEEDLLRLDPLVEEGYSVLKMRFEFPKPKGASYAPNPNFTAHETEREVRSVAFITKTEDQGTPGQAGFKQGELNKFFSHQDLRSATGLYQPLDKSGDSYTTSIKVRSLGFGANTEVAVIANYVENNLTQKLEQLQNWDELASVIADEATDNLSAPLLMFTHKKVQLASGATVDEGFTLSRIVARIDVVNEASDTDPAKGFVLTSAQLVNPRKQGYLTPPQTASDTELRDKVEVVSEFSELAANNAPLNEALKVGCLYTYETTNEGLYSVPPTAVRVKGTYKNTPFDKLIPIKKPDENGNVGAPIPLKRNHRYAINIKPGTEPNELTWTVKVADWDDGEEIQVKPPAPEIAIAGFTTTKDAGGAIGWNAATKTYDFTSAALQGAEVTFNTVSKYATSHTVSLLYDASGKSVGLDTPEKVTATVQRGDPVVTYAQVEQTYMVKLPQQDQGIKVPVTLRLVITSLGNDSYKDTVNFNIRPNYHDTNLKPVLLGGKFWAPVNVGAKVINVNEVSTNTMGYIYQWGHNHPSIQKWGEDGKIDNTDLHPTPGPINNYDDVLEGGPLKEKFIVTHITGNEHPFDWLSKADIIKWDARNNRWSPMVNDSPCPPGWRVPTKSELELIYNRFNPNNNEGTCFTYPGDEGKKLYLTRPGYRTLFGSTASTNAPELVNGRGLYWGSTSYLNPSNNFTYFWALDLMFNHTSGEYGTINRMPVYPTGYGFSLRCIQQDVKDTRNP